MNLAKDFEDFDENRIKGARSRSAQGLATTTSSPSMKIPLPPRMWITDIENESSAEAEGSERDEGVVMERPRVRSRFRHHKSRSLSIPIGIFWDIENCQVPRGCSAIDVVAAIRAKFLPGRREADFVVVCDVRKEAVNRLQELNDAQVSLIHVCGTQKNAADEKLRQCMRRFGELYTAPAALLLISGDINFAADLSDFRHRKNMEVILMHKQNTSSALIACASSHYYYNQLTAALPRKPKSLSQSNEENVEAACEMEVCNLPLDQTPERISKRLRRLADNCGGKVLKINLTTATLRFPTPDHASRALKRMDGEDVFGRKISTRYAQQSVPPVYSSDEGYSTAPVAAHSVTPPPPMYLPPPPPPPPQHQLSAEAGGPLSSEGAWALALQQLPAPTPPPLHFCPPPAPKPRKIRGTHGSVSLDRSGWSSSNSGDDSRRAVSPWNSSASFSEQSEGDDVTAELTVTNLPAYDTTVLQAMLMQLFNQYVSVIRVSVWAGNDGPMASVVLRSEGDARLAIARVHKRRLDNQWYGRRIELTLGRPSPAPNLDVLRARLRTILLEQKNHTLPLLGLRDAYASRHSCALTTSELVKVKDTVVLHDGFGRMVQLVDLRPVSCAEMEEAPWKCQLHAAITTVQEDPTRMLQPVFIEVEVLEKNVKVLLENHGGVLPLLSFVECYEAAFSPFVVDPRAGVALELLLRSATSFEVRDAPSRHLAWRTEPINSPPHDYTSESSRGSGERGRARTAPVLEPMLALLERELVDLLRTMPRCCIQFSKLIPAFHHHFGRQCRVADYGFTKLPDLLAALSSTIVVLGSGSSRVITLTAAAQTRRWTSDLMKMLKIQGMRGLVPLHIPQVFEAVLNRVFSPADYGVCTLGELMSRLPSEAISLRSDGALVEARRLPTPEEKARTALLAAETVELLCNTPNLRVELSRFVPDYHAHFRRQLRVGYYGCTKLVEVFEMIPEVVVVTGEVDGRERYVRLATRAARAVVAARLRTISGVQLRKLPMLYARQYGAPPLADMLEAQNLEELVYAAGGCIEEGRLVIGATAYRWASSCLAACVALSSDRSVARGSTKDYFISAHRRLTGTAPDIHKLAIAGVLKVEDGRLTVTAVWRTIYRLALILADEPAPLTALELSVHYSMRYEPTLSGVKAGVEGLCELLCAYGEIFTSQQNARWALSPGVSPPRALPTASEDYSMYDTPPGHKGSRVFESPKHNVWCSPPASALPPPSALLSHEKRRIRLAAQFDAS